MKEFGFSRIEKLKHKNDIDLLFKKGKWKTCGNIRIIYLKQIPVENQSPIHCTKIGVSVSKKFFKKAVDRNRTKRLLREAYRLNKREFQEKFGTEVHAMLFWVSPVLAQHYSTVEQDFLNLCKK